MTTPYFSVVIPAYNVQNYIKQTLESVFNQTFTDFEIIVVNDGSTDRTLEVLKGINDPRLRIINQDNGGECRARNRGMSEAAGRYLAFLDADDVWIPYHLKFAYEFFESHSTASWYVTISKGFTGELTDEMMELPAPSNPAFEVMSYYEVKTMFLSSSTIMLKSSIKEPNLFEPGMKSGGDRVGWLRYCLTTGDVLGILKDATTVYCRVQRPGAATALGDGYNEKFVDICLNSMKVTSLLMLDSTPNKDTKAFLRKESIRNWGWCIRYSLLQGWDRTLQNCKITLGNATAIPLSLIRVLHTLITAFFYSPFYIYSKIQNLK